MKSFFGRINTNEEQLNNAEQNYSAKYSYPLNSDIFNSFTFVQVFFDSESDLQITETDKNYIVADCRLDNKADLSKKLTPEDNSVKDELLVLLAFEKWNVKCLDFLFGDFSFCIINKETGKVFCARDHFGLKPFFFYHNKNEFAVSTEVSSILSQTDLSFTIDEQYIADTLSIIKSEKDRTQFAEIKKLPPAHYLIFENSEITLHQYWKLKKQKTLNLDENKIIGHFKSLLKQAVECRVEENKKIGAELSGGIDSSSIVSLASKQVDVNTFSHVLPNHMLEKVHPFKDERNQIILLNKFCEVKKSFQITSEDSNTLEAIKKNLQHFEYINQQNFNIFSDQLYKKVQEENISILLSGFGGDECVSSKSNFYLRELALNHDWKVVFADLKKQDKTLIRKIKSLVRLFLESYFPTLYKILSTYNKDKPWWIRKFQTLALNSDLENKLNIQNRYNNHFRENAFKSLQEIHIERITHNHVSQRLEYCSLAARKYGIEYRYPLLDKRLVEYYLSIPSRLKARNGIKRYAIRKAMEGMLPKEILWRNDKSGATIPTVFMRTLKDKNLIKELIDKAKTSNKVLQYIDHKKLEVWFDLLISRDEHKGELVNPAAFYNYLKLIIYIENNPKLFA